jgi:hypothetical protein
LHARTRASVNKTSFTRGSWLRQSLLQTYCSYCEKRS